MTCTFPNCKNHSQPNGYCIGHQWASSSVAPKKIKPIPRQSSKEKEKKRELSKQYALFLSRPENKYCKVRIDDSCTKIATVVHHLRGRWEEHLFDQSTWIASCPSCNVILESKDAEAREKGVKLSKFSTVIAERDDQTNSIIIKKA